MFRRLMQRITLAVALISSMAMPVGALPDDYYKLFNEAVRFYDPFELATSCDSTTGLPGTDNIAIIYNYLVGKGLEDFQAAGVMGNMWGESGYQEQRLQGTPSGTKTPAESLTSAQLSLGWGLVQWTPASKMISPTQGAGKDPNDINVQLDFLWDQLEGLPPVPEKAAGDALKATTDVASATLAFEVEYERHAGPPDPARIVEAQRILDLARTGDIATVPTGCSVAGSGLTATVFAYAWPDYHPAPYVTKKPEYEEAVTAAIANGQYVGGISYPGVDCGGFVTRVMLDSGYEPDYNYGGLYSAGAGTVAGGQKPWLDANWEPLGHVDSSGELQPGDVAIFTDLSHTYMYAGTIPNFNSTTASASLDQRAPMAGSDDVTASNVIWFRKN